MATSQFDAQVALIAPGGTTTRENLTQVSVEARRLLEVASFLGQAFSFDHVAAMLDVTAASLVGPLDEVIRSELLTDDGSRLAFPTEHARLAVMETVPASMGNALQHQAVHVLLAAGTSPAEPAARLATEALIGDRAAIATLREASHALGASDPGAAAELSHRALDLTPPGDDLRAAIVADTALLLHNAGRVGDAKACADIALRGSLAPEEEANVRMSVAQMSALSPSVRVEAGRAALDLPGLGAAARARHLSQLVDNVLEAGQPELAIELLPEVATAVRTSGDATATHSLLVAKSRLAYVNGMFRDALREIDAARRVRVDGDLHGRTADQWRAEILIALDEFEAAQQIAAEAVPGAHQTGHACAERSWRQFEGRCLLQAGRLVEAAAILDGAVMPGEDQAAANVADAAAMVARGRIAIHTGDRRGATACSAVAEAALSDKTVEVRRHAAWLCAFHALAGGDPVGAHWFVTEGLGAVTGSILPLLMVDVTDPLLLVRIGLAAKDHALACVAVAVAEQRHGCNPEVQSIAATAEQARGLLDRNLALLADAAMLFDGGARPLARASALEDYGVELVRSGSRSSGVEELGRALQTYSTAGAAWDAARVRRRLRLLGVRRRLVKPTRPLSGWAGLTRAELAVVRLVAEGLKNREVAEQLFISPHTVSMHLRHAFTKLEINSRVELTRYVFEHEEAA